MKTVFKYLLSESRTTIDLPRSAKPLFVAMQRGRLCIWIETDSETFLTEPRTFEAFGTSHPIPNNGTETYIGSVLTDADGTFVFHIYEVK